jgi:hypothetical protein
MVDPDLACRPYTPVICSPWVLTCVDDKVYEREGVGDRQGEIRLRLLSCFNAHASRYAPRA